VSAPKSSCEVSYECGQNETRSPVKRTCQRDKCDDEKLPKACQRDGNSDAIVGAHCARPECDGTTVPRKVYQADVRGRDCPQIVRAGRAEVLLPEVVKVLHKATLLGRAGRKDRAHV
jgi:hypothetical protein